MTTKDESRFFDFIVERHNIWYKRFILETEPPYTEDFVLNNYKYTNVYRELDRNTVYYIDKIVNSDFMTDQEKVFNTFIYRLVNNPELFDRVGFFQGGEANWDEYKNSLIKTEKEFKELKKIVFTNAYLVRPLGQGISKMTGYCNSVFQIIMDNFHNFYEIVRIGSPIEFMDKIKTLPGIADFIAYELYCDFCLLGLSKFGLDDFVNIGPGAKKGLIRIYGKENIGNNNNQLELLKNLKYSFPLYIRESNIDFPYVYKDNYVSLRVIEHSLCEYHKYRTQLQKFNNNERQAKRIKFTPTKPKKDYVYNYYKTLKIYNGSKI